MLKFRSYRSFKVGYSRSRRNVKKEACAPSSTVSSWFHGKVQSLEKLKNSNEFINMSDRSEFYKCIEILNKIRSCDANSSDLAVEYEKLKTVPFWLQSFALLHLKDRTKLSQNPVLLEGFKNLVNEIGLALPIDCINPYLVIVLMALAAQYSFHLSTARSIALRKRPMENLPVSVIAVLSSAGLGFKGEKGRLLTDKQLAERVQFFEARGHQLFPDVTRNFVNPHEQYVEVSWNNKILHDYVFQGNINFVLNQNQQINLTQQNQRVNLRSLFATLSCTLQDAL